MAIMTHMTASDIVSRICPLCNSSAHVVLPVDDHAICTHCGAIWELEDEAKKGYVCPTHRQNLRAYLNTEGEVNMWCKECNTFYVIPDTLNRKLKRAFVSFEELG